jgi:hypothetical protein
MIDFQQPGLMGHIAQQWLMLAPGRDDSQRDLKVLSWMLGDPEIQWYAGPAESVWYFTNFNCHEKSAAVHLLSTNKWLIKRISEIHQLFREVMDSHDLRKLYALIPAPAKKIKRVARLLNFKHEGTLRESVKFDTQWRNLDIYSLLRREVGRERKAREVAAKVA